MIANALNYLYICSIEINKYLHITTKKHIVYTMTDFEIAESYLIKEYLEDIECDYSINDEDDEVLIAIYSNDYDGLDSFIAAKVGISVEEPENQEDIEGLRSGYLWDYYIKTSKAAELLENDFKCELRADCLREDAVDLRFTIKIADIKQKYLIELRKDIISGILADE
ncbi:hypothetical protein I0P70_07060 [Pontibacter sp. FD36]|uniref:hypothetical protein n=1 Tax=Pontibacter sp. FD36 TaxID=2789860 RepID=UPI0018AAE201|nr:hypothetical protein [Pontibacter sp. FD36]MBF8962997.1 hypothetical protein [Pontibacter sp. FD36]